MALDAPFFDRLKGSADRLFSLLGRFSQARILVVGDLALDEFLTGQVERISREAPVLIIRHRETRQIPGGGANAVFNLAKLGGQVCSVGLVGQDEQGQAVRRIFTEAGIDTTGIFTDPARPTVTKTRISGHSRQSVTQQIVRVDRKSDDWPAQDLQQQLADYVRQQIPTVDAVVCSDYGDGVLTDPVIAAALSHFRTIVDSQTQLSRFSGALIFTPNLPEAEAAVGYPLTQISGQQMHPEVLARAGQDLLHLTQAQYILITRGGDGMTLFERSGTIHHIPPFNRTEVFDVTGAGDTVVAALTLALVAGATPWEAAVLGNLAASLVVRQFGTSTTTIQEMRAALQTLVGG